MQYAQANPEMLKAAEPIVRFVSKKMACDDMTISELERATARRELDLAAWSICVMPETAAMLNESPVVRAEMLKLLDLEHEDIMTGDGATAEQRARANFAISIVKNPQLYTALVVLAPDLAQRVSYLAS